MAAANYLRIGLQLTIVKAMASLPVQASCSITKVHDAVKTSSPERLPVIWPVWQLGQPSHP